jgi:hypothetical protein
MMRLLPILGMVLLSYLVTVVLLAPAQPVAGWVAHITNAELRAHRIEGRILDGQAHGLQIGSRTPVFEAIDWRFHGAGLWTGKLALQLAARSPAGEVDGLLGRGLLGGWWVRDTFAASPISRVSPEVPGVTLGGRLRVHLAAGTWKPGQPGRLQGTVNWEEARVTVDREVALGTIQLVLEQTAVGTLGELRDAGDGPLEIAGEVRWEEPQRLTLDLRLMPRAQATGALRRALPALAQPLDDGSYRIQTEVPLKRLPGAG